MSCQLHTVEAAAPRPAAVKQEGLKEVKKDCDTLKKPRHRQRDVSSQMLIMPPSQLPSKRSEGANLFIFNWWVRTNVPQRLFADKPRHQMFLACVFCSDVAEEAPWLSNPDEMTTKESQAAHLMLQSSARRTHMNIFVNTGWLCFMFPDQALLSGCPSVGSELQNLLLEDLSPLLLPHPLNHLSPNNTGIGWYF